MDKLIEMHIIKLYSEPPLDLHQGTLGCNGTHFGKPCCSINSTDRPACCPVLQLSSKEAVPSGLAGEKPKAKAGTARSQDREGRDSQQDREVRPIQDCFICHSHFHLQSSVREFVK